MVSVNNLVLNTSKTKEVIVYQEDNAPTYYKFREVVECINNILGIHITSDLAWSLNTSFLTRKGQQRDLLVQSKLPEEHCGSIHTEFNICSWQWTTSVRMHITKTGETMDFVIEAPLQVDTGVTNIHQMDTMGLLHDTDSSND
ncbi:hypothetical protein CCH79_00019916 [Gambusia affinis]|uniref:Uncharacterized protein n=1 Tax=Gambusia affinis TaxID=33528 RepID=A0A315WAY8_GAMAF|nr:hypothetical protein CCH79_00019916 [Gambusia affinis]